MAAAIGRAGGEPMAVAAAIHRVRDLRADAAVALDGPRAIHEAVALLVGLAVHQHVGDATPRRERRVRRRFAGYWKARVTGARKGISLSGRRLIEVLAERGIIDVAVDGCRADLAVVSVARK